MWIWTMVCLLGALAAAILGFDGDLGIVVYVMAKALSPFSCWCCRPFRWRPTRSGSAVIGP